MQVGEDFSQQGGCFEQVVLSVVVNRDRTLLLCLKLEDSQENYLKLSFTALREIEEQSDGLLRQFSFAGRRHFLLPVGHSFPQLGE